jgi:hypothetical protein
VNFLNRYSLVELSSGALLLDLTTGAIFELNESAALVWRHSLAGEGVDEAARALSTKYGLSWEVALKDTQGALMLSQELVPTPPTDFRYSKTEKGYSFAFCGKPVFEIDDGGERLTPILENIGDDTAQLLYLLRALAPKILALRGETVLHASAIELRGRVIAVCGISGAGKTTTARALVRSGARAVSEDQLIVRQHGAQIVAAIDGEQAIAAWSADAAVGLAYGRTENVDLARISRCTFSPLAEIGFIDSEQRTTGGCTVKSLAPIGTAGAVFRNAFYGSDRSIDWIRHLRLSALIGEGVIGIELRFPDGLDLLAEECRKIAAAGSIGLPSGSD